MRAIKIIAKAKLQSDKDEEALKQECQILLRYGIHPNICRLYEVYNSGTTIAMVMELVDGGDLFDGIVDAPAGHLSEQFAATVLHRTCSALGFLHKHGIAHRDIKPENLMLSKDMDVGGTLIKLADFGFATMYDTERATLNTTCGTPEYVAPEVLKQHGYGCECDVWSIGIVTYIMLCGYAPFHHDNVQRLFRMVMAGQFHFPASVSHFRRPPPFICGYYARHQGVHKLGTALIRLQEWDCISTEAKELLRKMLKVDPAERVTAKQILADPWIIRNVDSAPGEEPTVDPLELSHTKLKQ